MNFELLLRTVSYIVSIFLTHLAHVALGQTSPLKPLSVHVLDTTFGGNAPNVTCKLYRKFPTTTSTNAEDQFNLLAVSVTDADGRISEFLSADDYAPGTYRIWFGIGDYYQNSHGVSTFFPHTQITYENKDGSASHFPLVVSPYAISTYKGS